MKKVNPFIRIKQYYYTDGNDINCWVDEDDHEDFKEMWEEEIKNGDVQFKEERTIKGVDYNKWLIGNVYGDFEGVFVDEDCPECGCLLVDPELESTHTPGTGKERYCSSPECEWDNEEFREWHRKEDEFWDELSKKPSLKMKEDLSLEEFCEKYGFTKIKKERECVSCKRTVPVKEWFCISGYAIVSYAHDDCDNGGPSVAIPQGETAKEWADLLS